MKLSCKRDTVGEFKTSDATFAIYTIVIDFTTSKGSAVSTIRQLPQREINRYRLPLSVRIFSVCLFLVLGTALPPSATAISQAATEPPPDAIAMCEDSAGLLAYLSRDETTDTATLYTRRLNTSSPTAISMSGEVFQQILGLAWSPNSKFLAFSAVTPSSDSGIYIATVRSGTVKKITTNNLAYGALAWSPDGSAILVVIHDTPVNDSIVKLTARGAETGVRLSTLGIVEGVMWAPNAPQFVYAADGKLYLADNMGNNVEQIAPIEADAPMPVEFAQPSWSPDGQFIVVTGRDQGGHSALYTLSLQDKILQQIYPSGDSPAWSLRNDRIAFVQPRDDSGSDLFLVNADGSQACALTNDSTIKSNPRWLPR